MVTAATPGLFALMFRIPTAWAHTTTNEHLSFQGRLSDDTGNPVTGTPDLTNRLYTKELHIEVKEKDARNAALETRMEALEHNMAEM